MPAPWDRLVLTCDASQPDDTCSNDLIAWCCCAGLAQCQEARELAVSLISNVDASSVLVSQLGQPRCQCSVELLLTLLSVLQSRNLADNATYMSAGAGSSSGGNAGAV